MSPLANNLLSSEEEKDELFPLEIMYCPNSHNCQLSYVVPSKKMFDHYLYVSSTSKSFQEIFALLSIDLYSFQFISIDFYLFLFISFDFYIFLLISFDFY